MKKAIPPFPFSLLEQPSAPRPQLLLLPLIAETLSARPGGGPGVEPSLESVELPAPERDRAVLARVGTVFFGGVGFVSFVAAGEVEECEEEGELHEGVVPMGAS